MSRLLTPASRVQVTEVAVTPDVKLIRPAVIVDLERDQRESVRDTVSVCIDQIISDVGSN